MATAEKKSLGSPDETRTFEKGKAEVVTMGDVVVGKGTFEPGWKWSECVKPIAGTERCEVHHNGYVLSGSMTIVMNDGTQLDLKAGDAFVAPPGHDAWVTSSEPCVALDFSPAIADYARPRS